MPLQHLVLRSPLLEANLLNVSMEQHRPKNTPALGGAVMLPINFYLETANPVGFLGE